MKYVALALLACSSLMRAPSAQTQSPLFTPAPPVTVGPGSGQILFVDVDRDGRLDMVTRHLLQRRIGVFLGDGKGGFASAPVAPMTLDYQPGGLAASDVNSDGIVDLVATKSERDEIDVFLGNGEAGFSRAAGSPFAASAARGFFTRGVDLLDVNEDRRVDVVSTNGRENTFGILFGNGRGGFTPGPIVKRQSREDTRHTYAFGDVDGDGHVDALVAGRVGDTASEAARIAVLRGDGTGAFTEMTDPLGVPAGPNSMTLADVNGDRRADLVLTHSQTSSVSVMLNDGAGTFALPSDRPSTSEPNHSASSSPMPTATADPICWPEPSQARRCCSATVADDLRRRPVRRFALGLGRTGSAQPTSTAMASWISRRQASRGIRRPYGSDDERPALHPISPRSQAYSLSHVWRGALALRSRGAGLFSHLWPGLSPASSNHSARRAVAGSITLSVRATGAHMAALATAR